MVSLIDELVLFAYDDQTGRSRSSNLDHGIGGAALLELTLAERVDIVDRKVQVVDSTPTGDKVVDSRLRQLIADKPRRPTPAVQKLGRGLRQQTLDDLVSRGVLRLDTGKVLGIFPTRRYMPNQPTVESEARRRLGHAVDAGRASDARTAALAALVHAVRISHVVFPDKPRGQTRKALKSIAEGSWAGDATRKAVDAAQAAVMSAVTAAAAASGAAGGS